MSNGDAPIGIESRGDARSRGVARKRGLELERFVSERELRVLAGLDGAGFRSQRRLARNRTIGIAADSSFAVDVSGDREVVRRLREPEEKVEGQRPQ